MNRLALILILIGAGVCAAEDYGDAPASYGTPYVWDSSYAFLGNGATPDVQNPVTPAWTGDTDDAVLGTPYWDSWSSSNTLTVRISEWCWLLLWVDADDDGQFESHELYEIMPGYQMPGPADYTFENIKIHAHQDFSRNGQNKVAIRLYAQNNIGGPIQKDPNAWCYFGEIEDWLIDVEPAKYAVHHETLREATETYGYNAAIHTVNGAGGDNWSLTSGSLPQGMTLTQQGEDFVLAGTPTVGTAGDYTFTIQATDSANNVCSRTLTLEVTPKPFPMPFLETFSTNNHWKLDTEFAITQATGYVSTGTSALGYNGSEPANDHTPGNSDDLMLLSTPNGEDPFVRIKPIHAMSPKIDVSGASAVEVRFRRWYSVCVPGSVTNVRLELTTNGATWDTIWNPPYQQGQVADIEWSMITIDVTQYAQNKPWIRLRFAIGEHVITPPSIFNWSNVGWGVDDIEVRVPRLGAPLTAHDLDIQSPAQHQNATNMQWYPLLYPQYAHPWEVKIDNPTANDIVIDSIEGTSFIEVPPGSNDWWNGPPYFMAIDCWHDWGDFTLDQPVTIPANSTDTVVTGKFQFAGSMSQYWLTLFRARIYLRGTQSGTNLEVELFADDVYTPNWQSMPGVYVFETQVGTTQVLNGAAATGSRDFGSQGTGTGSNWLNIIIENTTGNDMTVGTPTLTGPDAGDFTLYTASLVNPIAGNDWTYFAVKFSPNSTGPKNATVEFTHPAPNTGTPFTFDVAGYGSANAPIVVVRETDVNGQVIGNGSPASGLRDFGQVDIGSGPTTARVVHIKNEGAQLLTLGTPTLTGPDAGEFALNTNGMAYNLIPGETTTFEFQFDPANTGVKSATVEFTHNDTGTADPFEVHLTGEAIIMAPVVVVAEGGAYGSGIQHGDLAVLGRQFGNQDVGAGATAAVQVFVRNDGWSDLNLTTPMLIGANPGDFVLDTTSLSLTIGAHSVTWFSVAFDPTAKGYKSAWVSLGHNDATVNNPFEFEVAGICTDPSGVIVTTQTLPHGRVDLDYTAQLAAAQGTAPYTWHHSSGTLPAGLSIASDGTISGKPTGPDGIHFFEVTVTDAQGGTESRQVQLILQPKAGYSGSGGDGGGCSTGSGNLPWLAMLGLLVLARRRRRTAQ